MIVDPDQGTSLNAFSLEEWGRRYRILGWWDDHLVMVNSRGVPRVLMPSEIPGLWIQVYAIFTQEEHRLARQLSSWQRP